MNSAPPLTDLEWREFLRAYSCEYLNSDDLRRATEEGRSSVTDVQRETGWLGGGPAGEAAVLAAERRLGIRLPPSYRNFLLVSDGWGVIADSLAELLAVGRIGWFRDLEPELLASWSMPDMDHFAEHSEMLERALLISGPADGDYWLLSPDDIAGNDEWTAYWWMAGDGQDPEPYDDFAALVVRARENFLARG
ncbi:SMI1/KNR4 family protein [Streptantibioticus silvisoli]|uniref:SMI1/KNR4 family protein n=1 Tax=Streptantibioticus silvisoli TaxID=2705255 RepID=A0ABT6VY39_9ACTN|nr:SMI1/KNR4 family protein [Streptantibioticus silvisoli]MDI5963404.1 SMI1/KNR4 family protein [Streptantibioticus silvisoli]